MATFRILPNDGSTPITIAADSATEDTNSGRVKFYDAPVGDDDPPLVASFINVSFYRVDDSAS